MPLGWPQTNLTPQLVVISSYTRFDNLAHGPRGTEAKYGMYVYRLDPQDGQMLLLSIEKEPVMNPAFTRFNSKNNVLYACTESVAENGQVISWSICRRTGMLTRLGSIDADGTSTCYITLDREQRNLLIVNYWDASLKVIKLDDQGLPKAIVGKYDPNQGREMKAKHSKHVNHSRNDAEAQKERQADPHSHALVLDPVYGRIAYVPDLGKDVIHEFRYDPDAGTLTLVGNVPSGHPKTEGPERKGRAGALGPRYIEFHPNLPVCYVINELSCEVSVFEFDQDAAQVIIDGKAEAGVSTLRLVQSILTVPEAFPTELSTCGRICVHSSGSFVLAANRGHDSIAVFQVDRDSKPAGKLQIVDIQHTRGRTPRHFKFDISGQWLIAANQDTDSVSVFSFNVATGRLNWTGHVYHVPSPNFVETLIPTDAQPGPEEDPASPRAYGNKRLRIAT